MNGEQIKKAVFNLTKDRIWDEDSTEVDDIVVDWLKLVLEEFPPESFTGTLMTLTDVVTDESVALPADFIAAAYFENHDNDDVVRYDSNELVFTADNRVIFPIDMTDGALYYYTNPVVEDIYTEIPINSLFHTCLIYYFYGQYYYQSGEGDYEEHKMADNYMGRFERMKEKKLYTLMNKASDSDPIKTTDAMPKRSSSHRIRSDFYE